MSSSSGSLTIEPTCTADESAIGTNHPVLETYHLIDRLDDLQHLVVTNLAVAVNVVELERPVELVLERSAGRHTQRDDEFLKVDGAGTVGVKDVENIVGECGRVAEREELFVDFLKLRLVQRTGGTVLEESYISGVVSMPR